MARSRREGAGVHGAFPGTQYPQDPDPSNSGQMLCPGAPPCQPQVHQSLQTAKDGAPQAAPPGSQACTGSPPPSGFPPGQRTVDSGASPAVTSPPAGSAQPSDLEASPGPRRVRTVPGPSAGRPAPDRGRLLTAANVPETQTATRGQWLPCGASDPDGAEDGGLLEPLSPGLRLPHSSPFPPGPRRALACSCPVSEPEPPCPRAAAPSPGGHHRHSDWTDTPVTRGGPTWTRGKAAGGRGLLQGPGWGGGHSETGRGREWVRETPRAAQPKTLAALAPSSGPDADGRGLTPTVSQAPGGLTGAQ